MQPGFTRGKHAKKRSHTFATPNFPTLTVLKLTQPHLANLLGLRGERPERILDALDAMEELFPELRCGPGIFGMLMEIMSEEDYFRGDGGRSSKLGRIRGGGEPLWDGHLCATLREAGIARDFCYSRRDGAALHRELRARQLDSTYGEQIASAYGISDPAEIEDCIRGTTLLLKLSEFLAASDGDFWAMGVYVREYP